MRTTGACRKNVSVFGGRFVRVSYGELFHGNLAPFKLQSILLHGLEYMNYVQE